MPNGVDRQKSGMWSRGLAAALIYYVRGIKPLVGVSLGDCALENKFSTQDNWI